MPFELQIIRATEFIRIGPQGHLDLQASKEALAMLAEACRKRGLDRAILDIRAIPVPVRPYFTPPELAALVDTFREVGFGPRQRLAVLYKSDPHLGARTFAFIGRMKGWHVRAFAEFETALLWLSAAEPEKRARREGQSVPIQFAQPPGAVAKSARHRTTKSRSPIRAR